MTVQQQMTVNREYKSHMFIMVFQDKGKLLELYNAVSGRHYEDPELLMINTLENAIYLSMKNDLSFLIDTRLSLYEHQSTRNPNMPLRFLMYLSDLYSAMVKGKNLYGTKRIPLPAPGFVVFYNGQAEQPDRETLYLSDSYMIKEEEVSLELKVDILNINIGHNKELLEACRTLGEYAEYVSRVRRYAKEMPIGEAVERTIEECIRENILREFLEKNRAEANAVSIYEYNEEEHMRMEREDAFADGLQEGVRRERINTERERLRAEEEKRRAEEEKQRVQEEKLRADQAEAEVLRLKKELAKMSKRK